MVVFCLFVLCIALSVCFVYCGVHSIGAVCLRVFPCLSGYLHVFFLSGCIHVFFFRLSAYIHVFFLTVMFIFFFSLFNILSLFFCLSRPEGYNGLRDFLEA